MKKTDSKNDKDVQQNPSSNEPKEATPDSSNNSGTSDNHIISKSEGDDFDWGRLRLSQDFSELIAVKKVTLTVPVRKPNRQEFIRVRPGEKCRFQTCVLTLKEERETYLVDRELWPILPGEIIPIILFTTINRQGVLFMWPVRLPSGDGRHDHWSRSAFEAAEMAESGWVRIAANMSLGAYEVYKAQGDVPEPEWPELSLEEILRIAFKDMFIKDLDHPVIRRLRGLQ